VLNTSEKGGEMGKGSKNSGRGEQKGNRKTRDLINAIVEI
jgi:hypothetical protein